MASAPLTLRIGTRGSELALWQATHAAGLLEAIGVAAQIITIKTRGDIEQHAEFNEIGGGKGIFVKEIEEALLARKIDLAVHSLKDLPTSLPSGLELAAVPERATPFDALIAREPDWTLETLPHGARVGTGSQRRAAQILAFRSDLQIIPLRGNVPTRLEKIRAGHADATLLAVAGLERLGLGHVINQTFPPEIITPSMGQGALAIESRAGEYPEIFSQLQHQPSRLAVTGERAYLARLGGGCNTPAGVLTRSWKKESAWQMLGVLARPDGKEVIRHTLIVDPPAGSFEDQLQSMMDSGMRLADIILAMASSALRALAHAPMPAAEQQEQ